MRTIGTGSTARGSPRAAVAPGGAPKSPSCPGSSLVRFGPFGSVAKGSVRRPATTVARATLRHADRGVVFTAIALSSASRRGRPKRRTLHVEQVLRQVVEVLEPEPRGVRRGGASALVLDHPTRFGIDARWAFVGPIAALGGERPLGYMRWDGAPPVADLAADGRTLLLWSPGLEADLGVTATVCRTWPDATLYRFTDAPGLGSVLAARVGGRPWQPRLAPATTRRCNAPAA